MNMKLPIGNSGQYLVSNGAGRINWNNYPFIKEFDEDWDYKYSTKCERMCDRFAHMNPNIQDSGFSTIYRLCEMLYKLKVWKL